MTIDDSGDRDGVLALNTTLHSALNAHDGHAFSEPWTDDADHVNIFGDVVVGRTAIAASSVFAFTTMMSEVVSEATVRDLRFLTPDVALLDIDQTLRGMAPGPNGPLPWIVDGALRTRVKIVAVSRDGRWLVASFQNTAIVPRRG
jgi:uncharacterized protein (TIGR02246 family)